MDRLDNVIRVVNNHETENYQVGQEIIEIQQELITLRQTVDSWNDDEEGREEENQDEAARIEDLPLQEDHENSPEIPPGSARPASLAGSATTVILSTLEIPLFC